MIYSLDCIWIINAQTTGIAFQCNFTHDWLDYFLGTKFWNKNRFLYFFIPALLHSLCMEDSVLFTHAWQMRFAPKHRWYSPHNIMNGLSNGKRSWFSSRHQRFKSLNSKPVATSGCLALHLHHANVNFNECFEWNSLVWICLELFTRIESPVESIIKMLKSWKNRTRQVDFLILPRAM